MTYLISLETLPAITGELFHEKLFVTLLSKDEVTGEVLKGGTRIEFTELKVKDNLKVVIINICFLRPLKIELHTFR